MRSTIFQRLTHVALAVSLLWIGLGTHQAFAAACTAAERTAADRQLWLNRRDQNASIEANLLWGLPEVSDADGGRLLVQRNYVIGYDDDLLEPLWTAHRIDARRLGRASRLDCFRRDPRLNNEVASIPADYDEPIFDQGHMVPNGDMSLSKTAVLNSFIQSNMVPQYCQFNRGVWQILETFVRHWADEHGTLYVISGAVFDRNEDGHRDADDDAERMRSRSGAERVAVPSAFYKILAWTDDAGRVQTLSILLPHDQTDVDGDAAVDYLREHVTTLNTIEQLAGIDFGIDARSLEQADDLWNIEGATFRSLVDDRCRATGHE